MAPMKGLFLFIGILVVVVMLTTSGAMGGAICLRSVGCIYSSGNGIAADDRTSVTVTTER
jgi:hypothetical protein